MSTTIQNDIKGLRTEVLLNYLYPELAEKWIANYKGTFYRNYSEDTIRIDDEEAWVTLSRDGMLKLLPQGLISTEHELKGKGFKGKYETVRRRKERLEELFRPFDTARLKRSLREEQELAELLENKLDNILKEYFHLDRQAEQNIYVRQMMALLPTVSRRRGNLHAICDILQTMVGHRVTMRTGVYNWSKRKEDTQPLVEYWVWVPNLRNEEYKEMQMQMEGLCMFLQEWFMPFDIKCMIELKCSRPASLGGGLTLNYNTRTDEEH